MVADDPASPAPVRPADLRAARRRRVESLAAAQAGVVSRRQLYAAGVTRAEVRANVRAGRWSAVGRQSVSVRTGPVARAGQLWAATFEGGPSAVLDGPAALEAAGLTGWTERRIRVSVPRGARVRRGRGLDVRQTRRWRESDRVPRGVPRTRPEVAAVRAALWARSDRQAALLLTMVVQQGISTPERIGREMLRVRRDRRRALVHAVLLDLACGSRSLGESELGDECRRRGLPEPDRQVVRQGRDGRCYVDAEWRPWGVVVEVDGVHHTWADQVVPDALRQNRLAIDGCLVLRLPLLGLRVAADDFFAQVREALVARGWSDVRRSGRDSDRSA